MTKSNTKPHKLPNALKTGFASDDWVVGISLTIVTALSVMAAAMLGHLFLMSQGWL
jgi:hypothetical protein